MIEDFLKDYWERIPVISEEEAIDETQVGLRLFDELLVGYASAEDPLFKRYRDEYEITYHRFQPPEYWLEGAQTVISIFFPSSQRVKITNAEAGRSPSSEWLHARIEGQERIAKAGADLRDFLIGKGYRAVVPVLDERFDLVIPTRDPENKGKTFSNEDFGSNWSERHVAYASGLGTFSLSKGIITKKGVAGRFISIVTDYKHEPTERHYRGLTDNCSMCGGCIPVCPPLAISMEDGKKHNPCARFVGWTGVKYAPRYGCGKCQVGVPCTDRIPEDAIGARSIEK